MRRIRFGGSLLILALAFGFAVAPAPSTSALESCPKCTCAYPNTGEYGVKENNDCKVTCCWVDIEVE